MKKYHYNLLGPNFENFRFVTVGEKFEAEDIWFGYSQKFSHILKDGRSELIGTTNEIYPLTLCSKTIGYMRLRK